LLTSESKVTVNFEYTVSIADRPGFGGYTFVGVGDQLDERSQALSADRRCQSELCHVAADRVRELDAPPHEHQKGTVEHHHALLLGAPRHDYNTNLTRYRRRNACPTGKDRLTRSNALSAASMIA
jgi:hypothetical protein